MKKMKKVCSNCGSKNVRVDAYARWNEINGCYDVDEANEDVGFCGNCDGEIKVIDYVPKLMIAREETWKVKTPMVRENSYGIVDTENNVELEITLGIKIDDNGESFSWFELYDLETGGDAWYAEGNIEIEGDEVTGYDGCFELSSFIVNKLKEWGYDCSEIE
jgi:hypothetical protein